MLQARFRQSPVARAAQPEGAHCLRQGTFYSSAVRIQLPPFLAVQTLPGRMQRFVLRLWMQ